MRRNSRIVQGDEIDLWEIIKIFWNEKILILSISLFFMVIGYVYGAFQPKIYKTEIVLREAHDSLFEDYRAVIATQQQQQQHQHQQGIAIQFNRDIKLNLSSLDTLVKFVEETNTINDFKNYLKEKNISPRNYFKEKFESVIDKKNNIQNKYSFTYSQPLPGPSFLNNYITFVKQQTTDMFKKQLEINIINEIKIHQHHLEIAKKIDLHNPILISIVEGRSVVSEPDALFYKGTKVLTQKIIYLNKLFNETKNFKLDYEFILEQASAPILDLNPLYYFMSIAAAFGLLFSIIIVFIKFYFLKLKL